MRVGTRAGLLTVVMFGVAVTTAACESVANSDGQGNPATTAPRTTASLNDERGVVIQAYERFWQHHSSLRERPESTWDDVMAAVAVDPQLSRTLQGARFNRADGKTTYGEVTTRVSDVDINGDKATIIDCQDTSDTGLADAKTGEKETAGIERNPTRARMKRDPDDGKWKVAEITYPGGEC